MRDLNTVMLKKALGMMSSKLMFTCNEVAVDKRLWARLKFAYSAFKTGDIYNNKIEYQKLLINAFESGTDYRPSRFYITIAKPKRFARSNTKEGTHE